MPDPATSPMTIAPRIARALHALVKDEIYEFSEGTGPDEFYKPFAARMPKTTELAPENLRDAIGIGCRWSIEIEPTDEFFRVIQDTQERDPEVVATYTLLEKVMKATLSDLKWVTVWWEGTENYPDTPWWGLFNHYVYIFGRTEEEAIAGLSTKAFLSPYG